MPGRISGYHIFFREEKEKFVRKAGSDQEFGRKQIRTIAGKWKKIDVVARAHYELQAKSDCNSELPKSYQNKPKENQGRSKRSLPEIVEQHTPSPYSPTKKFRSNAQRVQRLNSSMANPFEQQLSIFFTIGELKTFQDADLVDFVRGTFSSIS